jgi:hypothetical protein
MAEKYVDAEILELVVKNIVDHPEAVKIDRKIDEMGVLLTLKVDPKDMGHVVGRQGTTAKAIRTILRVVGARHHARVNLKIEEPEGSARTASGMVDKVVEDLKL